jgi:hypothetical protein
MTKSSKAGSTLPLPSQSIVWIQSSSQSLPEMTHMPRGKKAANSATVSKLEAVRRGVAMLGRDVTTAQLGEFLKSKYRIEMSVKMLATYRGTALKQLGVKKSGSKRGKKAAGAAKPPAWNGWGGEITVYDIHAVKLLVDKIGAEKVRQLAIALG